MGLAITCLPVPNDVAHGHDRAPAPCGGGPWARMSQSPQNLPRAHQSVTNHEPPVGSRASLEAHATLSPPPGGSVASEGSLLRHKMPPRCVLCVVFGITLSVPQYKDRRFPISLASQLRVLFRPWRQSSPTVGVPRVPFRVHPHVERQRPLSRSPAQGSSPLRR